MLNISLVTSDDIITVSVNGKELGHIVDCGNETSEYENADGTPRYFYGEYCHELSIYHMLRDAGLLVVSADAGAVEFMRL